MFTRIGGLKQTALGLGFPETWRVPPHAASTAHSESGALARRGPVVPFPGTRAARKTDIATFDPLRERLRLQRQVHHLFHGLHVVQLHVADRVTRHVGRLKPSPSKSSRPGMSPNRNSAAWSAWHVSKWTTSLSPMASVKTKRSKTASAI